MSAYFDGRVAAAARALGVRAPGEGLSRVGIQSALDTLSQSHFVSRSADLAHALATSGGTRAAADAVLAG